MKISNLEIKRQLFHLVLGVFTVALLHYGLITPLIMLIGIIKGLIISLFAKKYRIPVVSWFLDEFERKEDMKILPGRGAIYYAIGCFLAVYLFPKDIAIAAILILAFGDSISHLFGAHYGRIRHPLNDKKFLEGTLFGFLASFAISLFFVNLPEAFFASLAAMIVEAIEIKIGANTINDNLLMPLVSGIAISVVRILV